MQQLRKGLAKAKPSRAKETKGRLTKAKGNKGKDAGKADYVIGTGSRFDDFMSAVGATESRRSWSPPGFCYNFQSRKCNNNACRRYHACAGCNTANIPYVDGL